MATSLLKLVAVGSALGLAAWYVYPLSRGALPPTAGEEYVSARSHVIVRGNGRRLRVFLTQHPLGDGVPTVLLVHGRASLEGMSVFHSQLAYFCETANVISLDLPGYGGSDADDGDADADERAVLDACDAFRAQFSPTHTCSEFAVIAEGSGLLTSLSLLSRFPRDSVAALVLLSPMGGASLSGWRRRRHLFLSRLSVLLRSLRLSLSVGLLSRVSARVRLPDWSPRVHVLSVFGDDEVVAVRPLLSFLSQRFPLAHSQMLPVADASMLQSPLVNAMTSKFLIEVAGLSTMAAQRQLLMHAPSEADKWSLKNLEKWSATPAVGAIVEGAPFLPMKVMRQGDEDHSPAAVVARFPRVGLVIDLSKDAPPYRTDDGVLPAYVKLPFVSKMVPGTAEVALFLDMARAFVRDSKNKNKKNFGDVIAVHCHYGFNRTGFMICCYLVEEARLDVGEAIRRFARARPPGIKHQHFKDELYLRYAPRTVVDGYDSPVVDAEDESDEGREREMAAVKEGDRKTRNADEAHASIWHAHAHAKVKSEG